MVNSIIMQPSLKTGLYFSQAKFDQFLHALNSILINVDNLYKTLCSFTKFFSFHTAGDKQDYVNIIIIFGLKDLFCLTRFQTKLLRVA